MRMCLCNADSQKCKKKGQQKVPILKKTTGLYASRSYYSMIHMRTWLACRRAVNKSWQSIIPGSLAGCRLWHNLLQHQPPAQQTSLDDLFRGRPGLQCGAESRAHPTQPEMLQLPRYQPAFVFMLLGEKQGGTWELKNKISVANWSWSVVWSRRHRAWTFWSELVWRSGSSLDE